MKRIILVCLGSLVLLAGGTACGPGQSAADKSAAAAEKNAANNAFYVPSHKVEQQNYNDRQRLADNPSTILWCTFFPPTVGQEPITVPIAGKLTSSSKRPTPGTWTADTGGPGTERVGPDGMYGSSVEYRYGFDPTRTQYYDFTQLPSICTNTPLIWQKNKTTIAIQTDATLSSIDKAATAALNAGNAKEALKLLKGAESKGGK